jgi:hypothetical protein
VRPINKDAAEAVARAAAWAAEWAAGEEETAP